MREIPEHLGAKLLTAADEIGASFEDARMEEIASASGIPRATLYYYFSSKDEVLAFLLRATLTELADAVSRVVEGPGNAATRLLGVIRAQLAHMAANPATSQLLVANLGKAGSLPAIAAQVDAGFHAPVRKLLEEGVAEGTMRTIEELELGASALFGAIVVVGLRCLVIDGTIDVDRITASLAPMFWSGISSDPSSPPPRP